jgi:hypothetical protein
MLVLQIAPFVVVAVLAMVAVLSHCFDDNLLQRIGLSTASLGAALVAWVLARGGTVGMNAVVLLGYGVAIYGCGTVWKVKRFWRPR